jgi:CrcB protein
MLWVYVGVGGALGAVARYVISGWAQDATGAFRPFGTLAVNVAGSLIIGFVLGLGAGRFLISTESTFERSRCAASGRGV